MPAEFIKYFDPRFPVVIGGLNPQEDRMGMVQVSSTHTHMWESSLTCVIRSELRSTDGIRRFSRQTIHLLFRWVGVDSKLNHCTPCVIIMAVIVPSNILLNTCIVMLPSGVFFQSFSYLQFRPYNTAKYWFNSIPIFG